MGHPRVVEDRHQVPTTRIWQQHDDDVAGPGPASYLEGSHYGHPTRAADEQCLLTSQSARHLERVPIAYRDDFVADVPVEGVRPEVLTDALDKIGPARAARVHRALGVGADDPDPPLRSLLQVAPSAGDRPTRAHAGDEVGDPAGSLLPQLRSGRLIMRSRVVRVCVLVRLPSSRRLSSELV